MHTSWWIFGLWLGGAGLGIVAQTCNYLSSKRPILRTWGFGFGLFATLLAGWATFQAAYDWRKLPMTTENLEPGQLWDNGGSVAVTESDERRAKWEQLMHQPH